MTRGKETSAWTKEVILIIAALLVSIVLSAVILSLVQGALAPETNDPEYARYINIRDASDCTKANDTYCREKYHVCIHGYEYCQRQQCPEDFP